jgi:hypothetical protein
MCTKSNISKLQGREHTQETLKEQERHTLKIDQDGDVIMDEWTNCVYCVSKLSCSVL